MPIRTSAGTYQICSQSMTNDHFTWNTSYEKVYCPTINSIYSMQKTAFFLKDTHCFLPINNTASLSRIQFQHTPYSVVLCDE